MAQPRSFCPSCRTPIQPLDNVPVLSWLVLRGHCRRCGESISVRYPAVELTTAALFGATAWALLGHWGVPGMCALAATVLVLVMLWYSTASHLRHRSPSSGPAIGAVAPWARPPPPTGAGGIWAGCSIRIGVAGQGSWSWPPRPASRTVAAAAGRARRPRRSPGGGAGAAAVGGGACRRDLRMVRRARRGRRRAGHRGSGVRHGGTGAAHEPARAPGRRGSRHCGGGAWMCGGGDRRAGGRRTDRHLRR